MLLKIIGLFCKRALLKRLYSAKESYNFKEPTDRSHPIAFSDTLLHTDVSETASDEEPRTVDSQGQIGK